MTEPDPTRARPVLELRALACERGSRPLFEGVDAQVDAGRLLRIVGANGAGKTSLLRIICGLLAPTAGSVLWRGRPIGAEREEFHAELIYLGHGAALKDDLNPVENLQVACAIGGLDIGESEAASALQAAGLEALRRVPARRLSQGQRQRAALARLALGRQARLWVLDEPFNALDAGATAWLAAMLSAQLERGGLVVLTSHQDVDALARLPQSEIVL